MPKKLKQTTRKAFPYLKIVEQKQIFFPRRPRQKLEIDRQSINWN